MPSEKNEKDESSYKYKTPGFFKFLYESLVEKKPEFEPDGKKKNIFSRIGNAIEEYRGLKKTHKKNISTYEIIFESSKLSSEYFILLICSVVIASFGLLQNSTAVIIGAMIIAPLMTPILGFALGSIWGDRELIVHSSLTLLVGIAGAIGLSAIIGLVMPGVEMNNEILARTSPTLYDIIIALASGLVGSYAFVNPRISSSVSGVAIAVALVPPLAVTGICLGTFQWMSALGSILLFASNLVGISLAASFVFWRMKVLPYLPDTGEVNNQAKRNFLLSGILLALIAVPLAFFMMDAFFIKSQTHKIENIVKKELAYEEITTRLNKYFNTYTLECKIITSVDADMELKIKLQKEIENLFNAPVKIKLIIIKAL